MDDVAGVATLFAVLGLGIWLLDKYGQGGQSTYDANLPGGSGFGSVLPASKNYDPASTGTAAYVVPGGAFLLS